MFLEQTVSLIADEDAETQYLMQVREQPFVVTLGGITKRVPKYLSQHSCKMSRTIVDAGFGAVEVETASGQVLGAGSIRQAMADANLHAPSTWFDCMVDLLFAALPQG